MKLIAVVQMTIKRSGQSNTVCETNSKHDEQIDKTRHLALCAALTTLGLWCKRQREEHTLRYKAKGERERRPREASNLQRDSQKAKPNGREACICYNAKCAKGGSCRREKAIEVRMRAARKGARSECAPRRSLGVGSKCEC